MATRQTGAANARPKAAGRARARPVEPETAAEIARMEGEGGAQSAPVDPAPVKAAPVKAGPASTAPEYKEPAFDSVSGKPGLSANKARQGVTGQGVSYVLGFSLAGAVAVFLLLILWAY